MQWQRITALNKYGSNRNTSRFIGDLSLLIIKKDNCLLTCSTNNIPAFSLLHAATHVLSHLVFLLAEEPRLFQTSSFPEIPSLHGGALLSSVSPIAPYFAQCFLSTIYAMSVAISHTYLHPHTECHWDYRPSARPLA